MSAHRISFVQQRFQQETEQRQAFLQAYCRRLAGSAWDAEDLMQETLMKVYRSLKRCEARPITRTYLCRIAHHAWIDMVRRRKGGWEPLEEEAVANASRPDAAEVREALELLADQLPARQAVIVLMMDVFDFTARETAERLEATEGAVQAALHRARVKLQWVAAQSKQTAGHDSTERGAASSSARRQARPLAIADLLQSFLHAFQHGEPEAIVQAYHALSQSGVSVRKTERKAGVLRLYFRDPDGHLLMVTSQP